MTTTMYFVAAQADQGDFNLDLFVEATSLNEAGALWKAYYLSAWEEAALDEIPITIWPVPTATGKPVAFAWYRTIRPIATLNPQDRTF